MQLKRNYIGPNQLTHCIIRPLANARLLMTQGESEAWWLLISLPAFSLHSFNDTHCRLICDKTGNTNDTHSQFVMRSLHGIKRKLMQMMCVQLFRNDETEYVQNACRRTTARMFRGRYCKYCGLNPTNNWRNVLKYIMLGYCSCIETDKKEDADVQYLRLELYDPCYRTWPELGLVYGIFCNSGGNSPRNFILYFISCICKTFSNS